MKSKNGVHNGEYFSKAALKHRGWTDSAIKRFLPEHDDEKQNHVYRSAPPIKLYLINRVRGVEISEAFQAWKGESLKRRASSAKAVKTKQASLLERVRNMKVIVQKVPNNKVVKDAVNAYNIRKSDRYMVFDGDFATVDSDLDFLARITVNYIRHNLTEYDRILYKLAGKTGKGKALKLLWEKVFQAIADTYPDYQEECESQLAIKLGQFDPG